MPISTIGSNSLNQTSDLTINGQTVGKGGGNVATNTAHGVSALNATTGSSSNNSAFGSAAGSALTSGSRNTALGFNALLLNTTGNENTAVGGNSLNKSTTSSGNTALGYVSLYENNTGASNTAVGNSALQNNTTASNNTAVGYQAGNASTGATGTFMGYVAGSNLATGTSGTYIGGNATASSTSVDRELVICTGGGGTGKGSSTGFINPNSGGVYQGNNSSSWSTTSDFRLKKNIVDNTEGLDIVSQIRVRNFEYRTAEEVTELPAHTVIDKQGVQLGVIAQELQAVCSDCVKEESTGVLSVDTSNLTWHMINAIKELKAEVDALKARLTP